jgi:hypothetical protein
VFSMRPRGLAYVAFSENIPDEWPLCPASTEQSDNNTESLWGLWRDNGVAKM